MLPELIKHGGVMMWLLLVVGAVAVAVFIERMLHYHREQINSLDFINGVRNVLKRDNVVEAISICDATAGPVARLVKSAILNRDRGKEHIRQVLEEVANDEIPRLEERLPLLVTIARIAPVMGLLGTVLGFIDVFQVLENEGVSAPMNQLAGGVWKALVNTGMGLAISIPCIAGHSYLLSRVRDIVRDMEKAATEIVRFLTEPPKAP
jgi:biopolymer transport protein ExbB